MPRAKTTIKAATKKKAAAKKKAGSALGQARAVIGKVLGADDDSRVELDMNRLKRSLAHLPTGSMVLDFLIGGAPNKFGVSPCPGAPKGKIWQIYGHESSGKTTCCIETAATTCANGGSVGFLDFEYAFDPSYAAALGVPIHDADKFELRQPHTLEDGFKIVMAWASAGVDLIIIDSCGAGVPKVIFDRTLDKVGDEQRMGLVASQWSKFLPHFNGVITRTGSAVMAPAQIRAGNFGGMGANTAIQGGNAWKFYASIRMKLAKVETAKAMDFNPLTHSTEKLAVGIKVKARLDKCKVSANAHHEAYFYIRRGEGIDDLQSCIDIAIAHGLIKKGGAWYTLPRDEGADIRGQGMEKFRQGITDDDVAYDNLYSKSVSLLTKVVTKGEEVDPDTEVYEDDTVAEIQALMGDLDKMALPADPDAPPAPAPADDE
ncbi:DNA recombination/repair protein RecA [Deltaproteobacteria bacterium]|nr:DNA recombination/repair protein RecA [Deltaproteobacteria bacterium]